jgi:hypothetical protein
MMLNTWLRPVWTGLVLGLLLAGVASAGTGASSQAPEYHVTTTGSPHGDGSKSKPWDLNTALNLSKEVKPGSTIWVHGGTYKGICYTQLHGTAAQPIIVRNWKNERVTIDGGNSNGRVIFTIAATYTWFWGLEVMSSETNKIAKVPVSNNSWPVDIMYGEGVMIDQDANGGIGCKFINMIVHDTRLGFSSWKEAVNAEVYGCIVFDNGWQGPDQLHGHNFYIQNIDGTKVFADNFILRAYSHGIQAYGSGSAHIDNLQFTGNVLVNNIGRGFLLGSGNEALNPVFKDNVVYRDDPSCGGTLFIMNYGRAGTKNAVVTGNIFWGGILSFKNNENITFNGNTLFNSTTDGDVPNMSGNTWLSSRPAKNTVLLRQNKYEPKRAHITVLNWTGQDAVDVDVSAVLQKGDAFEVRDAQNYYGTPVLSGKYTGKPLRLPMVGGTLPARIGNDPRTVNHTTKDLGTFVLICR